jgi:hypothetical protein
MRRSPSSNAHTAHPLCLGYLTVLHEGLSCPDIIFLADAEKHRITDQVIIYETMRPTDVTLHRNPRRLQRVSTYLELFPRYQRG